ncbi:MAG TPA: hypothetical protein VF691_18510 [Cytophagaceae bacterium]|jgi:hypothetical protein
MYNSKLILCKIAIFFGLIQWGYSQEVVFNKHIAPIIFKNCSPCHNNKGPGPFPLLSYGDVAKRGKMIKHVTETRYMPPWHPDNHYREFLDKRGLTSKEISLIKQWVDQGMVKGGDTLKIAPTLNGKKPKPDLVLRMKDAYTIKGDNKERFMIIRIPYELKKDTNVCLCEFVPGNIKRVHHMDAYNYNLSPDSDLNKGQYFYNNDSVKSVREVYHLFNLFKSNGKPADASFAISDYFPGAVPRRYPEGIAQTFRMAKKGVILIDQIHYGGTSKPETDQSYFNIYFCKKKPERPITVLPIGTPKFKVTPQLLIQPNEKKEFTTQYLTPKDISLLSVQPHMHLIGKKFLAYAVTPQKDTIKLIKIDKWDFKWQRVYTFKSMLKIPAGSTIYAKAWYDNSSDNPQNPFNPPKLIKESYRTTDEMLQFWIYYVPYKPGDEMKVL